MLNWIKRFKTKPIIVEAIQWDGKDDNLIRNFIKRPYIKQGSTIIIHSNKGDMITNLTDWIVKDPNGEYMIYDENTFEELYEEVE